jgi:hypothetical protein
MLICKFVESLLDDGSRSTKRDPVDFKTSANLWETLARLQNQRRKGTVKFLFLYAYRKYNFGSS